ncbi:hypothetical protein INT43_005337 [Umbelopsis isabellina]|uniref:Cysteine proteinase n=1 Tax=Mortierella isabellina TaxID=91625 RepID=A0A8H7PMC5_MORIS|nr:hypothetical protein INT43_005337 [Umbelopsis isabellina]
MSEVNQRKRPKSNSIDVEPTSKKPRLESEAKEPEVVVAEPLNEPEPEVSNDLYLDTVNRQFLDFDFEKLCSVSLSNLNVYACLVCGKYYQGRGKSSHAYFHSIHEDHHVFINLSTLKVYVLPDGYEVKNNSLNDIKYVLRPTFTREEVAKLDSNTKYHYDLHNKKYLPGFVGLNNIKANDYVNVIIQALIHIPPIRNYFMLNTTESNTSSQLVERFGALVRKMWNPRAFKGQVSPHELLQEVSNASDKRFKLTEQSDPIEFMSWFLNTLHKDLGGTRKRTSSIVYKTFQGEVKVETQSIGVKEEQNIHEDHWLFDADREVKTIQSPFMFLALDLPPAPLYQDEMEQNIIPQVPLVTILNKYNGRQAQEIKGELKRYHITRLPNYLIFHIKRFAKNNWAKEKNPTIVNFPIKGVDLSEFTDDPSVEKVGSQYDLLANISEEGTATSATYKIHVRNRATDQWFQIQDLLVEEILPQMIFLSESYIQIWERRRAPVNGKAKAP